MQTDKHLQSILSIKKKLALCIGLALDSSHEGFEHSTRIVRRGTTAQRNVFLKKVRLKMLAKWDASCKSYFKYVPYKMHLTT
jgi:hypothetical protein